MINLIIKIVSEIWRVLKSRADIVTVPDEDLYDEPNEIPTNWHIKWKDWTPPIAPNQSKHKGGKIHPAMSTIHFTKSDASLDDTYNYMMVRKDAASYNYLVDNETGEIRNLVNPGLMSFSDGKSKWMDARGNWRKRSHLWSVSIAVCQSGEHPYFDSCYESVAKIVHYCMRTFPNYRPFRIAGHDLVAPFRKDDPGPLWDWERFFVEFVGLSDTCWEVFLKPLYYQHDRHGIISGAPDPEYRFRNTKDNRKAADEKQRQAYDACLRLFAEFGHKTNRALFEYGRDPHDIRRYLKNGH